MAGAERACPLGSKAGPSLQALLGLAMPTLTLLLAYVLLKAGRAPYVAASKAGIELCMVV